MQEKGFASFGGPGRPFRCRLSSCVEALASPPRCALRHSQAHRHWQNKHAVPWRSRCCSCPARCTNHAHASSPAVAVTAFRRQACCDAAVQAGQPRVSRGAGPHSQPADTPSLARGGRRARPRAHSTSKDEFSGPLHCRAVTGPGTRTPAAATAACRGSGAGKRGSF